MNPFLSMLGGLGGGGISASSSATSGDAFSGAGAFTNNAGFQVTGSGSSKQDNAIGLSSEKLMIIAALGVAGFVIYSLVQAAK